MSHVKNVLSLARQDLIPALARHGFVRHRATGSFLREIGEVLQFLSLGGTRSGGSFTACVDVWAPSLSEGESLPPGEVAKRQWLGGQLTPWCVDHGYYGWPMDDDARIATDLRTIAGLFETVALPWFAQLATPQAIAHAAPLSRQPVDIVNQLRELGDRQLCERMQALGFQYAPLPFPHFVRERGPYVQVIEITSVSCAVQANVWVHVATRWAAEAAYDEPHQPGDRWLPVNGGLLGTEGIDAGPRAWLVQGPDAVSQTVPALLAVIEAHALPWLDAVSHREAYLQSIGGIGLPQARQVRLLELLRRELPL